MEIRKFLAPEFVFGKDARLLASRYVQNFGVRKLQIVVDKSLRHYSWYKDIITHIENNGIDYVIFDALSPNPKGIEVMNGFEQYQFNRCNGILAIGGGSTIDCAKGIGIVSSNHKHILKFEGVDKVSIPSPPIICIPTTSGTSADVSQFAIIRDMRRLIKIAVISKTLVPDVALIDPAVTQTMDKYLTACTGMDALTHAIEAFVSNANSPITDNHSLNAIRLIKNNLYDAITKPNDWEARYNMMVASLEAGLAFSNASLGAVHAMAHSLGGYYDLAHGECNAILLQHVVDFNFEAAPERFLEIGKIFEIDFTNMTLNEKKKQLLHVISRFRNDVGISDTFKNKGVKSSDIAFLSKTSLNDPCIVTNPRDVGDRDIEVIFEEAM